MKYYKGKEKEVCGLSGARRVRVREREAHRREAGGEGRRYQEGMPLPTPERGWWGVRKGVCLDKRGALK